MTELSDLLVPEAVVAGMSAATKKALFQQLGAAAARAYGLDAAEVSARLAEREKLGSTGFGGGIAIPHGKLDGLKQVCGIFARLTK
ncbi:MAG: PTS lactose transporter subunit IIC, partial [Sphingomonadales bacterium]